MTDDTEKSSTENVTVVTGNFPTVSSLQSEDSTEQLICKTPQKPPKKRSVKSVSSKSAEAGSDRSGATRVVVLLGLAQVALGAALVGAGALAVVKGASLSRVGAGLWAGCVAVVAGVVGVLAGINDCYLNGSSTNGLLTAFLALSLLCLACGNSAAVLAATGLHRDCMRQAAPLNSFEDEMEAWTPVLTNISVLIIASLHCLVCILSIYHLSRRVCPCFRPKQPFDHNQFDPTFKPVQPCVFHVDEIKKAQDAEKARGHELCKELETKLQGGTLKKKKEEPPEFGSANSKEKLVTRWLGHHHPGHAAPVPSTRPRTKGVRKNRKHPPGPMVLVPAHPASTLGRVPLSVVVPPAPRYATLPLPPAAYGPLYYPAPDGVRSATRVRRRRSPRAARPRSPRAARPERQRRRGRRDDSQLTRSLERIHRKRRPERDAPTVDDLKRTYTGLDRAYAEQFIAVCDESRHAAVQHDSLTSTDTSHSHPHSHSHLSH